jgi:hypothetical protein
VGSGTDQHVHFAPLLLHLQMAEVGRREIERLLEGLHPQPRGKGGQAVHLRHDLGDLVLPRLAEGVAQFEDVLVEVGGAARRGGSGHVAQHGFQDGLLLEDQGPLRLGEGGVKFLGRRAGWLLQISLVGSIGERRRGQDGRNFFVIGDLGVSAQRKTR